MHATAQRAVAPAQPHRELAEHAPPPALLLRMLSISLEQGFGLKLSGAELAALIADGIKAQYRGDPQLAPPDQLLHDLMELIAMDQPTPSHS